MAKETEVKKSLDISVLYSPKIVGNQGEYKYESPIFGAFEKTYATAEPFVEGFAKVTKLATKQNESGSFYLDLAGNESKEKTETGKQLYAFLKGEIEAEKLKCDFSNPDIVKFVGSAAFFRFKKESENIDELKEPLKIKASLDEFIKSFEAAEKLKQEAKEREARISKISRKQAGLDASFLA